MHLLDAINTVLMWNGVLWLLVYGYIVFFNKGIPNIETAPAVREQLIAAIKDDIAQRGLQDYTVVDVGSGSGAVTRALAAALPDVKIIGIEINAYSVHTASRRAAQAGLKNLEYRQTDFMEFDFSIADAVVMFLLPGALNMLKDKLRTECRPGALLTANKFPIPGWQPFAAIPSKSIYLRGNLYLYRQRSL